jgi:hypothetical protein
MSIFAAMRRRFGWQPCWWAGLLGLLYAVCAPLPAAAQNVAPVARNDSYTVAQDALLTVAAPGVLANDSDANGDALTARRSTSPASGTLLGFSSNGAFSYRPTAGFSGTVSFTYRAVDPSGSRSARATVTITVTAVANQPPRITSTPPSSAVTGVAYSYPVAASDPNGDVLTYSLAQAPSGMTINASTGLIAWTPTAVQAGAQPVSVRVADPGGLSATQSFSVTVTATNSPPQFTSSPLTTATVGVAYAYAARASDPNGDVLTYALAQAPTGMTINASTGQIAWTPSASQAGTQPVAVRAADPGGLSVTQTYTVTVTAANAAPQIVTSPVVSATEGVTYAYDVNATDPNGDVLTYALTQAPAGMTINAATGLIAWTPISTQSGAQNVTVRVADPGGLTVLQSFTITVDAGAPVPTTTRVDPATPATIAAAAGSQAGVTLNWYRVRMAANYLQFMHLVNGAGQTWSVDDHATTSASWSAGPFTETRTITVPAGLAAGSYDIRVGLSGGNPWTDLVLAMGPGVTDPANDHRYKVGTLTIGSLTNQPPLISSAPVTAGIVGTAYRYTVAASDPNGDVLVYSLTQAPSGMAINANSGVISWTPTSAQLGNQSVTVRVVDPGGLAATQSFSVNVAAAGNGAPQISSSPVTTATVGAAYAYAVMATDPNGDTLSYSLTQAPGGMSINAGSGQIAWTPGSSQAGTQAVSVRVADPGGLGATQSFSITVAAAPPPPAGSMTMACADGADWQCSGDVIIGTNNGVALTRSGVQVYGRSTSDLQPVNPNVSDATGLAPASGGVAEMRVRKDANAAANSVAVLLSNFSILWDGRSERPTIIETFNPTAGRVSLNSSGALSHAALPPSSDLGYYDYALRGTEATRANYANNRYFPRSAPPRCDPGWCASAETSGAQFGAGSWRAGGTDADTALALRYHEDGDIHAGNGLPDANGNPTWLPGGNGFGVPVPGSKGYRTLLLRSYRYANLAGWTTQDTHNIVEWGGVNEHNKNRKGYVAFGDTTDPVLVPAGGSASYSGVAHGRYAPNGTADSVEFVATVTLSVNLGTRAVAVTLQGAVRDDGSGTAVPANFSASTTLGGAGNANYFSGSASGGSLSGGLGGRLFGPVAAGGSGTAPAEIGGAFALTNAGTGAIAIGGFIARKQ